MKFKIGDRVVNTIGEVGTVVDIDEDMDYLVEHDGPLPGHTYHGPNNNQWYYIKEDLALISRSNNLFEEWMA